MSLEEFAALKDEVSRTAQGRWGDILAGLAPQLQPALDRIGRHVPCPVHGGKDGFRVFPDVDNTGGSVCNTCGKQSDGFATLMWANGWKFAEAVKAVAEYLRVGARNTPIRPQPKRSAPARVEDDARLQQSLDRVRNESVPITASIAEPARLYLARRGISIAPPDTLRFHAALPYYEGEKKLGEYLALIAVVASAEGEPVTIHRTYLMPDGRKAPVASAKKLMAYPKARKIVGGAIRLIDEETPLLAVAEGIETALAVREGMGLPVWSTVNALLLANFAPPATVRRVLVFADKDRPCAQHPQGHGQEAARQLVQRLWVQGVQASALVPVGEIPDGEKSLDWMDVLKRQGKAGFPSLQAIDARLVRQAA